MARGFDVQNHNGALTMEEPEFGTPKHFAKACGSFVIWMKDLQSHCMRLAFYNIWMVDHFLPTCIVNTLIQRRGLYNAWKWLTSSFPVRIEMLRLMNKRVLKLLIFGSDDINNSNFENANKYINKSWWYLLKHVCFIVKLNDFVISVYIFNGRKQMLVNTIGILPVLRMHGLHDKRHLLAKLRICDSENSVSFRKIDSDWLY